MPIDIEYGRRSITVLPLDAATDFDLVNQTIFKNGIRLSAIRFSPSLAGDTLIVRGKGSATGPILFKAMAATGDDVERIVQGNHYREKLYIEASEQTWSAPTGIVIVLEYD